ncbi:MAG: hypothetical protein AB7N91_28140 [Candidatus Tectimicrobiota bacterium]
MPAIARQLHHGVLVGVTLEVVDQCQSGLAGFGREVARDRVAEAAEKPRLLRGDLPQGLQAHRASGTDDEVARPHVWDNRCGVPWIGGPPIGHDQVVQPMVEECIHNIHVHARAAGTAPGPCKGVGQCVVATPWRPLFEAHPAKRCQYSGRTLGIQGCARRAQRQLDDLLPIRHRLRAVESLMQGVCGQHGVRVALPEQGTAPSSRHRRVGQQVRRHQGHNVLTRQFAAGPLHTLALTSQGL